MTSSSEPTRRLTPELLATLLLVLAYIVWLLSMPAWPSQDGPVHLYYTHVFGALLSHQPTVYARYYTIKHLLPPYALYYYALLALSKLVPLFLADRIVICAYILSFVFGFRYLARSIGPAADGTTLLSTLLLLNWSLGMGFVNFCLSLSFAFWAIGLWLRFSAGAKTRFDALRRVGFVLLAFMMMFTHPVPLALVLALCFIFFVVDLILRNHPARSWPPRAPFRDLLTLASASLTLIYIKLFTSSHPLQQVEPDQSSFRSQVLHHILGYAREDGVALLFGHSIGIRLYRISLGILLVLSIGLALRQRRRNRAAHQWTCADTLLIAGLVLLLVLPFIPSQLNGLFYFAARLPLIVWVVLLLAASGSACLPSKSSFQSARLLVIAFAVVSSVILLISTDSILRPIARSIAAVETTPTEVAGQVGFILEDPRQPVSVANGPSWNPFYWAAIHVVRHNRAILANAPWMDETILPVGPAAALPEQSIPALRTPQPSHVYDALMDSSAGRAAALSTSSFFVVTQIGRPFDVSAGVSLLSVSPSQSNSWTCEVAPIGWYSLCHRNSSQTRESSNATQSTSSPRIN